MSDEAAVLKQQLVNILVSSGTYNDKGFMWAGHTPAEIDAMHRKFSDQQLALATAIGFDVLGAELTDAIQSGRAARDDLGTYASLAEKVLGVRWAGR